MHPASTFRLRPTTRDVLARPHVPALLAGTLVGRLPTAMAPLTLLLAVRAADGPVVLGSILAALYALAGAIGQPLLGRLVDRSRLGIVSALGASVAFVAFSLLAATDLAARPLVAGVLAVLAGAATPPLEAGLRALWPRLVPDPAEQRVAFTLDSVSQEIVFVAGPLAATALCELLSPAAALWACGVIGGIGAGVVATRPPAGWPPTERREVHWSGPLRSRGLLVLLAAMLCLGVNLGAFNVLAITLADRTGAGWLTGLLPAALSVGSLLGGIAYTRSPWPLSPQRQLLAAAGGYALSFTPMLIATVPLAALAFAVAPGLYLSPLLAVAVALCDRLAPRGTATEAAAWLVAVVGVGQALGTAVAGRLAEHGTTSVATLTAFAAVLAAAVLLPRPDLLNPRPATSQETSA
ncbi:MFS transporter [Kitasatospora sp. NPDC058048]|uniref:MFS transporter n=1 Tax=Kitasatospora sp. NPDC058048 TaxID=3346313 RepID=UPI0036DE04E0